MELNFGQLVSELRSSYKAGKTRSVEWRTSQLLATVKLLEENSDRIYQALHADLGKCYMESIVDEVDFSINEANHAIKLLRQWMKPEHVKRDLANLMDKAFIQYEPLGVVLNMTAWNYPVQLIFGPLVAAIAAGNCMVVKPSELASNTAKIMEELFPKYYDKDCIRIICGGIPESTALLREKWDHIMYTGNSQVAKVVAAAAATHLTPVTLELGGKCPVYVDSTSDLKVVAARVVWGKFKNSGQTCLAPDYVLCAAGLQDRLSEELKKSIIEYYGTNPESSPDYSRIINDRHFKRVVTLLKDTISSTTNLPTVVCGNSWTEGTRYIAPTVLNRVSPDSAIMQEEIFGPVLPLIVVNSAADAVGFINAREKPLALYVFSNDNSTIEFFMQNTSSGSFLANDNLLQSALRTLPFGGVGNSGMGHYRGWHGFANFSHKKACLIKDQSWLIEYLYRMLRYPPYNAKKLKYLRMFFNESKSGGLPVFLVLAVLAFIGVASAIIFNSH